MLLVKTLIFAGFVTVSFDPPKPAFLPDAFKEVREVKKFTVGERFDSKHECMQQIRFFFSSIPQKYMDDYDVRTEGDECVGIIIEYYVPAPIPMPRPSI